MFGFVARPLLAVAVATLVGGIALVAPPVARAAPNGLQIVTQTRYVALPAEKRIHVTVQARATNVTPDPPTGRYYYSAARFAVHPAIRNLTASSGGATLVARIVSSSKEFTTIEVAFGRSLFHGTTYPFMFAFDILDPGGLPQRDVRVAASLVAFPIWAFGSRGTAGSSVSVTVPAGYAVTIETGDLTTNHASDGSTILTTAAIPDPQSFFAYITAERPGAFHQTSTSIRLPEGTVTVQIRAWEDDPAWGARTKAIVSRGLPVLRDLIGLDYQVHGPLRVEEAAGSRLGDYAGVYNTVTETIDVRYDADGYTTLHETAHTWFNDNLLSGRWIAEAWAEYYGVEAGKRIATDGQPFTVTAQLSAAKIPLNAWGGIGDEPPLTEEYGYAASYRIAQLIAARSGISGLHAVWRAAEDSEGSYQPAHPGSTPEKGLAATVEGWQRLLDLLEERTKHGYTDLWRQWVVTVDEARALDARSTARADYARTVTAAADWELPYQVRYTLGAWQFAALQIELADARSVLADRDRIAAEAARLNLHVPGTLKADFESGTTFDLARQDGGAELAALTALGSAIIELGQPTSALESVGLLFADPAHRLGIARADFEKGDADSAVRDARAAREERRAAANAGRIRVGVVGGGALLLDGLAMGAFALRRRRRRRIVVPDRPDSEVQAPFSAPSGHA
ncbi:MAG: M1 family metallopeptidase [Chloroflexi bacterium]|nr:MAG: M1 family metallopeptidase [Chloroflexota bacterium]